jgi:hypothetical protein
MKFLGTSVHIGQLSPGSVCIDELDHDLGKPPAAHIVVKEVKKRLGYAEAVVIKPGGSREDWRVTYFYKVYPRDDAKIGEWHEKY